ncbi:putative anaerobic dimethyl sulfoxide reductase, subunit C [Shewanella halifaxensis HAW-EB4]|uniref:Anaerobic dimethyl sulfoxide reductase, subunit C n=1 Tax=Shewanella halifaxensis (strain HAW-EB4) TaxID=458817 RepID=B0TQI7_SHEHH|nr:DmsC/YnfH family molybdoenzyme membrane anchor subunit [Shewanella halifaxensis]ABZ74980.1 putative anaerobic dimethyl sulfoxide reductase, subunit C [Shewanella halifaxensis HAW-EB4]
MHEIPLVIFTVLAQAVAGSFILLCALRLAYPQQLGGNSQLLQRCFLCLWSIFAIAGLAATTHLGQPLRAANVLFGLAHLSPMSVEIIMVSIFGALGTGSSLLLWRKADSRLVNILLLTAALAAIGQLFAIANVYSLPTVYLWSNHWTPINLVFSGLITGSMLTSLLLNTCQIQPVKTPLKLSALKPILAIIFLLTLVLSTAYAMQLTEQLHKLGASLPVWLQLLQIGRISLLAIGFISCLVIKLNTYKSTPLLLATLTVLTAEILGRILFYELGLLQQL